MTGISTVKKTKMRAKVITILDEKEFSNSGTIGGANAFLNFSATPSVNTLIDAFLTWSGREILRLKRLWGSIGLSDDPTDEHVSWFLWRSHIGGPTPPITFSDETKCLWVTDDRWRVISTGESTIRVTRDFEYDFDLEELIQDARLLGFETTPDQPEALFLMVFGSTTSSVVWKGQLEYEREWAQREWREDFSEWSGYEAEESGEMA